MSRLPDPPARLTLAIPSELRRRVRRAATAEHRTESAQMLWYAEEGVRRFEASAKPKENG